MGTTVEIKAVHPDILKVKQGIYNAFKEMERIDGLMGYSGEQSDVVKINTQAGNKPVRVSYETFKLLSRALKTAREYKGLFDPTIGVIEELWGFNSNNKPKLPAKSDLKKTYLWLTTENLF